THIATPASSELHFEAVEAADDAVDRKDDATVVDEHVVDLAPPVLRLGDVRHKIADLLGLVWVFQIEGAQAAAEKRAEDDVLALPAALLRQVFPQIVGTVTAAAPGEGLDRRHRAGRDRHRVLLGAVADNPDQLRPI